MRTKQQWMMLTQDEIDDLTEEYWEHYSNGGCMCYAHDKSECCCGAWWRE